MSGITDLAGTLLEDLLARGLRVRLPVSGISMGRAVRSGDVVTLARDVGRAGRGDLVLFRERSGTLVLHRILRVWRGSSGGTRYQTRGDACIRLDPVIAESQVLARVLAVERPDGEIIHLTTRGARLRARARALVLLLASGVAYKLARLVRAHRERHFAAARQPQPARDGTCAAHRVTCSTVVTEMTGAGMDG